MAKKITLREFQRMLGPRLAQFCEIEIVSTNPFIRSEDKEAWGAYLKRGGYYPGSHHTPMGEGNSPSQAFRDLISHIRGCDVFFATDQPGREEVLITFPGNLNDACT